ncbi:SagB/ThcOx family dehydrogenase [Porphyromonadaceae bacterium OttesenSCG-928-L07]|nr:SagB/ThcOx family dehydrogenase [Porphyromonadaceae bacterium OttesenSCG-928-L07]MDL2251643.1 SagB/ThcOx family dehydrogenase [Odoribacter sp. OttesenSCG-928-J03]
MRILAVVLAVLCYFSCPAQSLKEIQLNQPDKTRGHAVMKAFDLRKSDREFSEKMLSIQDLSDLLWAANGINRADKGLRTAPSAMNKQDIDIYVCMAEGVYLYHAKGHKLTPVVKEDVRPLLASAQEFVKKVPVCLLMVSDGALFNGDAETKLYLGALDAGIVSQNIALFCAGTGLVTVPRAYMDKEKLHKTLKLREEQQIMINNPIGYSK